VRKPPHHSLIPKEEENHERSAPAVHPCCIDRAVADPDSYITMTATVPEWDTHGSTWTSSSTRTAKLALVGIHIVGSTGGHPEMLWATFEHFGNTPDATYSYTSKTGTKTVKQSTAGRWLFSSTNASAPFNLAHARYDSTAGTIDPANGFAISASNTLRQKPFGACRLECAAERQSECRELEQRHHRDQQQRHRSTERRRRAEELLLGRLHLDE
jgi:hypothetical protein